jgi:hypothetical protein
LGDDNENEKAVVFDNGYATAAGEDGLPLYLQQQGQAALRRLGTSSAGLSGRILQSVSLCSTTPIDCVKHSQRFLDD